MRTRIFKIEDKNNKLLMFVDLAQDPSPNTTKEYYVTNVYKTITTLLPP